MRNAKATIKHIYIYIHKKYNKLPIAIPQLIHFLFGFRLSCPASRIICLAAFVLFKQLR